MAFLDEARQLAEQARGSIEQGLEQVRVRIDELQRQRRFSDLARHLGLLVYRARRAGTQPDEAEVERICAELAAIEATLPAAGTGAEPGAEPGAGGPDLPDGPATSGPPAGPPRGYSLDDV